MGFVVAPIAALVGTIGIGKLATFAVTAGLAALQLLTARQPKQPRPDDIKNTVDLEEGPGRFLFGRVQAAGVRIISFTKGFTIYRLIGHSFGELDGIEETFYGGQIQVVELDGRISSPPYARPGDDSYISVLTKPGDGDETAWAQLRADFPDEWTVDHRLRGIFQSLIIATNPGQTSKKFGVLYQGGIRELELRCRVGKFLDPRDSQTRWTMNAAIIITHYTRLLPTAIDSQFDFADIGITADWCDGLIDYADGSQVPQGQLSGGGEGNIDADVLERMAQSAGLEFRFTEAGLRTLRPRLDYPDAEIDIRNTDTETQILEFDFEVSPEAVDRPNVFQLEYFASERQYAVAEVDISDAPWARFEDDISLYGEKVETISLDFCPELAQALRIARRFAYISRAARGNLTMTMAGLATWGKRYANITLPEMGENGTDWTFRAELGQKLVNDEEGTVQVPFIVIPDELATPFNPATDEVDPPPILEDLEFDAELDDPSPPTDALAITYPDNQRETRIRFAPVSGADIAEASFRTYTGGLPDPPLGMDEEGLTLGYIAEDYEGERVDFRVRFFNSDEEGSKLSEYYEVASVPTDNTPVNSPSAVLRFDDDADGEGDGQGIYIDVTVPDVLRVVAIKTTTEVFFVENTIDQRNVRPTDTFTVFYANNGSQNLDFNVTALTSDGTEGTPTFLQYFAPEPGGA